MHLKDLMNSLICWTNDALNKVLKFPPGFTLTTILIITSSGCCSMYTVVATSTGGEGRNGHQQTVTGLLKQYA